MKKFLDTKGTKELKERSEPALPKSKVPQADGEELKEPEKSQSSKMREIKANRKKNNSSNKQEPVPTDFEKPASFK